MMKQRALAIAIATAMVAAGVSLAPPALAASGDCDEDFQVAESESNASIRKLSVDELEIGLADTDPGEDRTLNIELVSGPQLEWQVFHRDSLDKCVEYSDGGCGGPTTMTSTGTDTCTLRADELEEKDFWVHIEANGDSAIDYKVYES